MFELANAQSLTGLVLTLVVCWALSRDRRKFPWKMAAAAIGAQVALVLLLFGTPAAQAILAGVAAAVDGLGASARAGTQFVFGFLAGGPQPYPVNGDPPYLFAFQVLPVILLICALSALLWHWGILKWITRACGILFQRTLGLRGPPGLAAAATIFMGQIEGPIFIRDYLEKLTRSELFMLVTVGMACVSGSTMVAYATILTDVLPNAAAHVFTASIISAPAGVLLARILEPAEPAEKEEDFDPGGGRQYSGAIDALITGTTEGLKIVLNVGATLIVFVGLIYMVNLILGNFVGLHGQPSLSIEQILGLIFSPLAWTLGIPWKEAGTGGLLLGTKLVLTEFSAFIKLGQIGGAELSERSRMIMTYALCGFANFASVGINVAGYSALVPSRSHEVIGFVWKALLGGFLATCMTASIIGAMPTALFGK
jgi:CNT family concentrative nucleoside transporter